MAYASITYTSASGTTFALTNSSGDPIEYLRQNDISVTVNGVLKTLTTDYTFNTAGTAIVLNTAVSGATVIIARTTDIADATVSFTAGSTLTAQDLNNSDKQNRFALQEFSDIYGALTTGTGDLSALGGFIGSAETWLSDNAHAPTTGAVDTRVDSKIDTALTTDVVAGDSITVTDNSPSSGQITIGVTNASISTAKLVDSSVTTAKIADGNVTTAKILDANVTTAKILDANVTTAKIADNAVTSAKIADGTIVAADLASDSVTTAKILDSNVTTGKINDLAVTTAKLADSSVTSAKIVDGTIVAGDLASDSVTTAKIVDSNVTTAKINDSAVTTGKIADSAVTAIKIADGVITSAKLNAATVVTAAEQAACTPDDVTFFTTSASDGRYVNVTGDSMTGALAMGSNKITGLGTPTANADAATKLYVDNSVAAGVGDADYGDITVSGTGTIWTIDSGAVTSAKIADGTIVNGDINASAAIAGTKISPDFGSQTVQTTGIFSHALGTAGAPTVTFTGDTNTGIYSPGADQVAISTNGTGRLFIGSDGSVGIGAAAAATVPLDITDTGNGIRIKNAASGNYAIGLLAGTGSQDAYVYQRANAPLIFGTNNQERLRITSAGLVGVGVSSPSDVLHVEGTIRTSSSSNNAQFANNFLRSNQAGTFFFDQNSGGQDFAFRVSNVSNLDTTAMTIKSSGRVGIGTSSPQVLLHGTTSVSSSTEYAGVGFFENSLNNVDTSPTTAFPVLKLTRAGKSGASYRSSASFGIARYENPGTQARSRLDIALGHGDVAQPDTTVMTLLSSGNVGIGTTSPGGQLDVSGTSDTRVITRESVNSVRTDLMSQTTQGGVGTTSNHPFFIQTNGSERCRVDTSGRLLVGTSSARSNIARYGADYTPATQLQTNVTSNWDTGLSLINYAASGYAPVLTFGLSASNTNGTNALVADGHRMGVITFNGNDGTNFEEGARIEAFVDGTPGAGDMPGRLVFSTTADGASSPTERMRITNAGYFKASNNGTYQGTTGTYHEFRNDVNDATLFAKATNASFNQAVIFADASRAASSAYQFYFARANDVNQFYVRGDGVIYAQNTTVQSLSDARVKENVQDSTEGLDIIKLLRPVRFDFKDGFGNNRKNQLGFIAQEVESVFPDAVDVAGEADENNEPYKSVGPAAFIPVLVKALQDAAERIEQLESKVAALESA